MDVPSPFAHHLRKTSDEELQELGPIMAELEAHPGWVKVTDLIRQEREMQMKALIASGDQSEQEYARALGVLKGMDALGQALETVKAKAAKADETLNKRLAGAAAEATT